MSKIQRKQGSFGEFIRRPYVRHIFMLWVVLTVALIFFAPVQSNLMGTQASLEMDVVKETMTTFSLLAAPVAAIVLAVAIYSLFGWRFRGKGGPAEDGSPQNNNSKVVVTWIISSSLLCLILLVWGLQAMSESANSSNPAKVHTVDVIGNQWVWNFKYEEDGGFSSSDLVLPVGEPVMFNISSVDVIHSFWIVEMGVKMDANPHEVTHLRVTPNKVGDFTIRCAELCGLNHSAMFTKVHVLDQADYSAWLESKKQVAQ